jgi:hypothetical protein
LTLKMKAICSSKTLAISKPQDITSSNPTSNKFLQKHYWLNHSLVKIKIWLHYMYNIKFCCICVQINWNFGNPVCP